MVLSLQSSEQAVLGVPLSDVSSICKELCDLLRTKPRGDAAASEDGSGAATVEDGTRPAAPSLPQNNAEESDSGGRAAAAHTTAATTGGHWLVPAGLEDRLRALEVLDALFAVTCTVAAADASAASNAACDDEEKASAATARDAGKELEAYGNEVARYAVGRLVLLLGARDAETRLGACVALLKLTVGTYAALLAGLLQAARTPASFPRVHAGPQKRLLLDMCMKRRESFIGLLRMVEEENSVMAVASMLLLRGLVTIKYERCRLLRAVLPRSF